MDPTQQVKNQVTSARTQIFQQIESARQYLRVAQQDVHQFVEQQRAKAKTQQTSQVVEAARQAASAKVASELEAAAIKSETQAKLRDLVAMIQDQEHPSQQQVQQRTLDVTEAAGEIFNQVTQLFDSLSSAPVNQPVNLNHNVPQKDESPS